MTKEEAIKLSKDAAVIEFLHVIVESDSCKSKDEYYDEISHVYLCFITEDGSTFKFPIGINSGNHIIESLSQVIKHGPYRYRPAENPNEVDF